MGAWICPGCRFHSASPYLSGLLHSQVEPRCPRCAAPHLLERHGLDPRRAIGPQPSRQAHTWPPRDLALVCVLHDAAVRIEPHGARQRTLAELHRLPGEGSVKWTEDRLKGALGRARSCDFLESTGPRMAGGFVLPAALSALAPEHQHLVHPEALR